jgi:hypothetical protein
MPTRKARDLLVNYINEAQKQKHKDQGTSSGVKSTAPICFDATALEAALEECERFPANKTTESIRNNSTIASALPSAIAQEDAGQVSISARAEKAERLLQESKKQESKLLAQQEELLKLLVELNDQQQHPKQSTSSGGPLPDTSAVSRAKAAGASSTEAEAALVSDCIQSNWYNSIFDTELGALYDAQLKAGTPGTGSGLFSPCVHGLGMGSANPCASVNSKP